MFDPTDQKNNLGEAGVLAGVLRQAGLDWHDANTLALLGTLPDTDGLALLKAALRTPLDYGKLIQTALAGKGQPIAGCNLSAQEAFARCWALGYEGTPEPVAFHCIEDGCHARVQLMLDHLLLLGVPHAELCRFWVFCERAFVPKGAMLCPVDEGGKSLLEFSGVPVGWTYHVAVGLRVNQAGVVTLRVIDPALFARLADRDEWLARLKAPVHLPNIIQVADLGVRPFHPATGHPFPDGDYWPFALPGVNTQSQHATLEMQDLMEANVARNRPERLLPTL